ncbi:uncharacterized protein DUF4012 [Compostimonas suwonensis]|uniref:Uncharacterized protein DUF4012 n=1 Tax=Compostimonas suwonensis TaxID=1048394 RepID=A0A2M9BV24_9MICO|nr:uncharacterized protein DUF4012 [Compostimonas suwonensis]
MLIAGLGCAAWLATRVLIVKNDLEAAQTLVDQLQAQATSFDLDALAGTSDQLQTRSAGAVAGADDPIWRAAEYIPVLGENLSAVRIVAGSIDDIVQQVAVPAIDTLSTFDLGARDPVTGGFDLTPLDKAKTILASATTVFGDAKQKMSTIDTANTIGPVKAAVEKFDGLLTTADTAITQMTPLVDVAGNVLGQNGPRSYLLAFQNNAESTALGGSAAAYSLMSIDNGSIAMVGQANSGNFVEGVPVDVPVDQSALDLYGSYLVDHINTSTSRPDFPTAASIMRAFWLRDQGSSVDGVISIDPLALARILEATGPITLSSGDVLSSDNAVSLLVNGVYMRYPRNEDAPLADAFFQAAASEIINKITTGDFDIKTMTRAITEGINHGSIMMWSASPDEQALLDGTPLQGTLPKTNDEKTVIGVYYRDTSASKIDYYLQTSTRTTTDVCTAPANPTFSTSVTLHSNLTVDEADALPQYVMSRDWLGEKFRTEIFVYGPIGASVSDARVDVQGLETIVTGRTDDLGRPVASFAAYLAPGETTTVTATFIGAPGAYGPLEVRGTPMINTTENVIEPPSCG